MRSFIDPPASDTPSSERARRCRHVRRANYRPGCPAAGSGAPPTDMAPAGLGTTGFFRGAVAAAGTGGGDGGLADASGGGDGGLTDATATVLCSRSIFAVRRDTSSDNLLSSAC